MSNWSIAKTTEKSTTEPYIFGPEIQIIAHVVRERKGKEKINFYTIEFLNMNFHQTSDKSNGLANKPR